MKTNNSAKNSYVFGSVGTKVLMVLLALPALSLAAFLGPSLSWNTNWTTAGVFNDDGFGIFVDGQNNSFVVGKTNVGGNDDALLIKFNSSGSQQWNVTWGGIGNDYGYGVFVHPGSGFIYMAGLSNSLGGVGDTAVIAVFNPTGGNVANFTYDSGGNDAFIGVAIDMSNNTYAVGWMNGGAANPDVILEKFNSSNESVWNATFDTGGFVKDYGYDVIIDPRNDNIIYVAGYNDANNGDALLLKYNSSGNLQWNVAWDNFLGIDIGEGVAVDNNSNPYLCGRSDVAGHFDGFLAKYDSAGVSQWNQSWGGPGYDDLRRIMYLPDSNAIYGVGYTDSAGAGSNDSIIVKYDTFGNSKWTQTWGTAGAEKGLAIAVTPYNSSTAAIYITGLVVPGGDDVFINKYLERFDWTQPNVTFLMPGVDSVRIYNAFNFTVNVIDAEGGASTVKIQNDTGGNWIDMTRTSGTANDGNWSAVINTTGNANGNLVLTINATDTAGNYNDSVGRQIVVDNTAPSIAIVVPIDFFNTSNTTVTFQFNATDIFAANMSCGLAIGGIAPYNSNDTVINGSITTMSNNSFANGNYSWNIMCSDGAVSNIVNFTPSGNSFVTANRTFTVDTLAPVVTPRATEYPQNSLGYSSSHPGQNVTLVLDANDTGTGVASVTVAGGSVCTQATITMSFMSGIRYNGTCTVADTAANGANDVQVNATDLLGNSNTSASLSIVVDKTIPQVTFVDPSSDGVHIKGNYNVTVQVSDSYSVARVMIQNGTGGTWVQASRVSGNNQLGNWSAVINTTAIADGTQVLTVNASDFGDNSNNTVARTVIVDNTAPNVAIVAPVNGFNSSGTVTFQFNATDNLASSMSCGVAIGAIAPYNSNNSVINGSITTMTNSSFAEGNYSWNIMCADGAVSNLVVDMGNSFTTANRTFTVDTTKPTVTYMTPVAEANISGSANFTVNVVDTNTGVNLVRLQNGTGGNFLTMTRYQGDIYNGNYTYLFDSTETADGHDRPMLINASDNAGNYNDTVYRNVTIDRTIPYVTTNEIVPLNNTAVSGIITINVSFVDATSGVAVGFPGTFYSFVNASGTTVATGSMGLLSGNINNGVVGSTTVNTSTVPDGPYNITLNITDNAGNINNSIIANLTVDNMPPVLTILLPATGYKKGAMVINASATDINGSGIAWVDYIFYQGGINKTDAGGVTLSGPVGTIYNGTWNISFNTLSLLDGDYNVTLRTRDNVFHVVTATVPITIDNAAPQIWGFASNKTNNISRSNAQLNFTVNVIEQYINNVTFAAGATVINMTNMGGNVWSNATTPATFGCNGEGVCMITATATDLAGNSNVSLYALTTDNVNPNVTFYSPTNGQVIPGGTGLWTVNFSVFDLNLLLGSMSLQQSNGTLSGIDCSVGNATYRSCTNTWNYSSLPTGTYQLTAIGYDMAGVIGYVGANTNSTTINVTVDKTLPTVSLYLPSTTVVAGGRLRITANITDNTNVGVWNITAFYGAGNVSYLLLNGTGNTTGIDFSPDFNYSGNWTVIVVATDTVGNTNTVQSDFNVLNGLPMITATSNGAITGETFNLKRSSYQVPVPTYGPSNALVSGEWVNPFYLDTPSVITATVMEELAYNYTVTFTPSSSASQFTLMDPGALPGVQSSMSVYTPGGTKTLTRIAADFTGGTFTVYYNNTAYTVGTGIAAQGSPLISGSMTMPTPAAPGYATIALANATSGSAVPVTILYSTVPPINISQQTITGFNPTNPPALGSTVNASYYLNLTGVNQFYSPDGMKVAFIFPRNVTVRLTNGTSVSYPIASTTVSVYKKVAGVWTNITGDLAQVEAYSDSFVSLDNLSDSPTFGANTTVDIVGYRYLLGDGLTWLYGSNVELMANVTLSFPIVNETVPAGATGATSTYLASIQAGCDAGIIIPTDKMPRLGDSSSIYVYVNGKFIPSSAWRTGSIIITGELLRAGPNDIKVSYTIPSPSSPSGGTTGGEMGGALPPTTTTTETHTIMTIGAGETQTVEFSKPDIPVSEIEVTASEQAAGVQLTVSVVDPASATITIAAGGTVYSYMQISTNEPGAIQQAVVNFKVDKAWLAANGLVPSQMVLSHFSEGAWTDLATDVTSEDDQYVYFSAVVPSFSLFAITAKPLEAGKDCRSEGCASGKSCKLVAGAWTCVTPAKPDFCTTVCPEGQSQNDFPDCSCYVPGAETCTTQCATGEQQNAYPDCGCVAAAVVAAAPDYMTYGVVAVVVILLVLVVLFREAIFGRKKYPI
jgi:PGF-pre-PGF domain-containing protein